MYLRFLFLIFYIKILDNLTKRYTDYKDKINPKKKFTFSNKASTKNQSENINVDSLKTDDSINILNNNIMDNIKNDQDEMIVSNKNNEKIIFTLEDVKGRNSLFLENLIDCEIHILFNFKALYAKEIKNCKIFIGSISGGSHITDCSNCSFYLITHQLRIHKNHNTNFNIIVSSNPIIEDCTRLIFSSLKIKYKDFENNLTVFNISILIKSFLIYII